MFPLPAFNVQPLILLFEMNVSVLRVPKIDCGDDRNVSRFWL